MNKLLLPVLVLILSLSAAELRAGVSSDQAGAARREGFQSLGSQQPSMRTAGRAFDGGLERADGATSVETNDLDTGLSGGSRDRFAPAIAAPADVPAPAPVETEREVTPYKGFMIAAIAGLLLAIVLMILAGKLAKNPAMKPVAAAFHLAAAAMGALALSMGVILMTSYGQTMQGLIFTAAGGLLAAYNIKKAYDVASTSEEPEQKHAEMEQGVEKTTDQVNENLHVKPDAPASEPQWQVNDKFKFGDIGRCKLPPAVHAQTIPYIPAAETPVGPTVLSA
ncbi:MAG: hypothetical protein HY925_00290 [Elusimicrobia bacterium]|nr:hypothetical protein [Elusimicrobiota bacterium]